MDRALIQNLEAFSAFTGDLDLDAGSGKHGIAGKQRFQDAAGMFVVIDDQNVPSLIAGPRRAARNGAVALHGLKL